MERVSKAQAVKLKELGYDVKSDGICDHDGNTGTSEARNWNLTPAGFPKYYEKWMSMPYLDEVIDWLDGKGVYVIPKPSTYVNQSTGNIDVAWMVAVYSSKEIDDFTMPWQQFGHLTRTTAKSAGIDKALDILSQQNSNK